MERFQQARYALGSDVYITLVSSLVDIGVREIFKELWSTIDSFEEKFSRFKAHSELNDFNQKSGQRTTVSPEFREMLIIARQLAIDTNELYTPFILPSLQKTGYKGSWPAPEKSLDQTDYSDRQYYGIDNLMIGKDWAQIPKNAAIEFGGIGKGFLLDKLTHQLPTSLEGYWLSIGGDIILKGVDRDGDNWKVMIQSAANPSKNIGQVINKSGSKLAVATSGIIKRKGLKGNQPWHHIINPRTGGSAKTDLLTATVCYSTAVKADVYAKCLIILGSKKSVQFIKDKKIKSALLQRSPEVSKKANMYFGELTK